MDHGNIEKKQRPASIEGTMPRFGDRMRWLAALVFAGCTVSPADSDESTPTTVEVNEDSFGCITDMEPVGRYYATNLLGNIDETLEVAAAPEGKRFPAGTLIQLIPMEAMVKREAGFAPETDDWEFFFLSYSDGQTTIQTRGADATNSFGDNCASCHTAVSSTRDWVCEDGNGCVDLNLSLETIQALQQNDARCP